jgi:hypothetical protein
MPEVHIRQSLESDFRFHAANLLGLLETYHIPDATPLTDDLNDAASAVLPSYDNFDDVTMVSTAATEESGTLISEENYWEGEEESL